MDNNETIAFNEACMNCGNDLFSDEDLDSGYCAVCWEEIVEAEKADQDYEYSREQEDSK